LVAVEPGELATLEHVEVVEQCRRKPPPPPSVPVPDPPATAVELATMRAIEARDNEEFRYSGMDYAPMLALDKLRKLAKAAQHGSSRCVRRSEAPGLLLKDVGRLERDASRTAGLLLFVLPRGTTLFKGTRYFHDDMEQPQAGVDARALPYMWVGSALTAAMYAQRYHGGIMVYRAERDLRLLVLTRDNCNRVHAATQWRGPVTDADLDLMTSFDPDAPFDALSPIARAAFETKFGSGIALAEQARRVRGYRVRDGGSPDRPLPIYRTRPASRFTYCAEPESTRTFGAGANDRRVAAFIRDRANTIGGAGGVDGWFSPESFSPFNCGLSEELLLLPGRGGVSLDTAHPLFWRNWIDRLRPTLPRLPATPFDLSPAYFGQNQAFRVLRRVVATEDSLRAPTGSRKSSKTGLTVLTYNAGGLSTPNRLIGLEAAAARCAGMIVGASPSVAVIQQVPESSAAAIAELITGAGYRLAGQTETMTNPSSPASSSAHVIMAFVRAAASSEAAAATIAMQEGAFVIVNVGGLSIACVDASGTSRFADRALYADSSKNTGRFVPDAFVAEYRRASSVRSDILLAAAINTSADVVVGSLGFFSPEPGMDPPERKMLEENGFAFPASGLMPEGDSAKTLLGRAEDLVAVRMGSARVVGAKVVPFADSVHPAILYEIESAAQPSPVAATLPPRQKPGPRSRKPWTPPTNNNETMESEIRTGSRTA